MSGPFLSSVTAHCNITYSCISYLSTSLVLIDPTCTPNNARTRVLQGYHGLHHYADEFWIDHLLQYFKLKGSFDKVLLVALERALQFQKYNLLQNNNAKFAKNTLPLSLHKRFELISAMSGVPELRSFIQKILLFRTHSALNENGTGMSQKGIRLSTPTTGISILIEL